MPAENHLHKNYLNQAITVGTGMRTGAHYLLVRWSTDPDSELSTLTARGYVIYLLPGLPVNH